MDISGNPRNIWMPVFVFKTFSDSFSFVSHVNNRFAELVKLQYRIRIDRLNLTICYLNRDTSNVPQPKFTADRRINSMIVFNKVLRAIRL